MNKKVVDVQKILRYTFGVLVVVAGLDKFSNLLVDWGQYLAPFLQGDGAGTIMLLVGVIEILVGLAILFGNDRIVQLFSYLLSVWLLLAAGNLLLNGFLDIAVRDIVLAVGAFGLARLTEVRISRERNETTRSAENSMEAR